MNLYEKIKKMNMKERIAYCYGFDNEGSDTLDNLDENLFELTESCNYYGLSRVSINKIKFYFADEKEIVLYLVLEEKCAEVVGKSENHLKIRGELMNYYVTRTFTEIAIFLEDEYLQAQKFLNENYPAINLEKEIDVLLKMKNK